MGRDGTGLPRAQTQGREQRQCVRLGEIELQRHIGGGRNLHADDARGFCTPDENAAASKLRVLEHRNCVEIVVEHAGERSERERTHAGFKMVGQKPILAIGLKQLLP